MLVLPVTALLPDRIPSIRLDQTLINKALREYIEAGKKPTLEETLRRVTREELRAGSGTICSQGEETRTAKSAVRATWFVGRRQRLIREPRVSNESSRARGTHDIAAPKPVGTENCICHKSSYRVRGSLLQPGRRHTNQCLRHPRFFHTFLTPFSSVMNMLAPFPAPLVGDHPSQAYPVLKDATTLWNQTRCFSARRRQPPARGV
jgi:Arc/MetJ family transcription regulator